MAYTNIDDPSAYFQTAIYSGSNSDLAVTNDGNSDLKPDLLWIKQRSSTENHMVVDSTRGVTKYLSTDNNGGEATVTSRVASLDTDGFTLNGASNPVNASGATYVGWQWKCNGGTTSSNTDGDLTSTVQFNSTAGFAMVTYTGKDPIEPLDVGHGMGEVPDMFIIKNRSDSRLWVMYHKELTSPAENRYLILDDHQYGELANSTIFRNEAPTTTIIKTGENAAVNKANDNFVVYAWKERQGFSKFGKYVGNGSTEGTFVYTGFKPAWIMCRRIDGGGNSWDMHDSARDPFNPSGRTFYANTTGAELTGNNVDLLSNGFKQRDTSANRNGSGNTYIYIAFAENPFTTSTGVPCTAR
jgi:hypothetical protein